VTTRYRVGVIGDPIAHSISPAMHQPAFDALGINATYERWQTPAAELPERIASLREPDALGANVTVPHKLAVMELIDEVSPLAQRAGAVNTVINRDGKLYGENTDVYGFSTSLLAVYPEVAERRAMILGAGGAARAVVLGLDQLGVKSITIANRSRARAQQLVADLGKDSINLIGFYGDEFSDRLDDIDMLINATSVGWQTGEHPIDLEMLNRLPGDAVVVDLTYRDTDLLLAARERELTTLDGLPMLVHQGAKAFELFTGQAAPVEIMMSAALSAREPR
jgi:shikimate dehydrogenase